MRKKSYLPITPPIVAVMFVFTAMFFSGNAFAAKIGYVNVVELMQKSPQAIDAGERLRDDFSDQRAELEECNKDFQAMSERMKKDRSNMRELARERLNRRIISKRRDCQRLQEEFREDFNERRNKEFVALEKTMEGIINDLAEREGYDLIVSGSVLFVGDRIDLTNKVLDVLNKRSKGKPKKR